MPEGVAVTVPMPLTVTESVLAATHVPPALQSGNAAFRLTHWGLLVHIELQEPELQKGAAVLRASHCGSLEQLATHRPVVLIQKPALAPLRAKQSASPVACVQAPQVLFARQMGVVEVVQ